MTVGKQQKYTYPRGRHHSFQDLTSQKFGKLTAIKATHSTRGKWHWDFQCACGNIVNRMGYRVKGQANKGGTPHCGCSVSEVALRRANSHGYTNHPIYWIWRSMKARCLNPKHKAWKNYGGRGITVCEQWLDFRVFLEDMLPTYQQGLDLDRKDNNLGYCKENCRWVTRHANCNNKRNSVRIQDGDESLTIKQFCEKYNLKTSTVQYRLSNGITMPQLAEQPDVTRRFTTS